MLRRNFLRTFAASLCTLPLTNVFASPKLATSQAARLPTATKTEWFMGVDWIVTRMPPVPAAMVGDTLTCPWLMFLSRK